MAISKADQEKLQDHFKSKITKCPVCSGINLTLHPDGVFWPVADLTNRKRDVNMEAGYFVMLLECDSCHYLMPFNAVSLGL